MLYTFRNFLHLSLLLLLLGSVASCHNATDTVVPVYKKHQFDRKVMDKLPVYDSLAQAIVGQLPIFLKNVNENDDGYKAFRYMPASTETNVFKKLPGELDTAVGRYYNALGKELIYGFDVFRDSSIKIYISRRTEPTAPVDIEENLSYHPVGGHIQHRDFPMKDTILNDHWQYWARFDLKSMF